MAGRLVGVVGERASGSDLAERYNNVDTARCQKGNFAYAGLDRSMALQSRACAEFTAKTIRGTALESHAAIRAAYANAPAIQDSQGRI